MEISYYQDEIDIGFKKLSITKQIRLLLQCCAMMLATAVTAQEVVYEIEDLNVGLSAAPERLDRSSPHGMMSSFIDLTASGHYDAAAHLLNLARIPGPDQPTTGPYLAELLAMLVDRKIVLNWAELLDRPDALNANATTKSPVAGDARRSILIAVLTIKDRPYPIRIERVKAPDEAPVWVFSERSVENIEVLHEAFGPSEMEQMLPAWVRKDAFWNLKWWEVIGFPITLLVAGFIGLLTHYAFSRLAKKADRSILTRMITAIRSPVVIFTTALVISLISSLFIFSGPVSTILSPLIALGFVLSALVLVVNVVDQIIDQIVELDDKDLKDVGLDDQRETATKVSLVRRMLIVIIVLIGFGVVLTEAGVFRTFGFSLLASAGAVTLILGFAAREVLSNIMSSMQIALNQSARIGDKVVYNGMICNVERINFTYVLLRVWTGVRLVVPVTEFVSETFENWTIKEPKMTRLIEIHTAHMTDVSQLRDVFSEVLKEVDQEELGEEEGHQILVTGHDVFGQVVTFCLSCSNPNTSWDISCEVRERLISRMQDLEKSGNPVFPDANPAEQA